MATRKAKSGRRVRLMGPRNEVMIEGTLSSESTLADLVGALGSRHWRLDDEAGDVLCGPGGVRVEESTAASRDAATED